MFSEEGRQSIKEDFKKTDMLVETAVDIATKESVGILDYNQQLGNRNKYFDASKQFVAENPDMANTLNDPNATPAQKQVAMDTYVDTIAGKFGVSHEEAVLLIATNQPNANGEQVKGAHINDGANKGTIAVNDNTNNNALETANTLGHETTHYLNGQGVIGVSGGSSEEYANIMGAASSDYLSFNYSNQTGNEYATGDNNNHVGNGMTTSVFNPVSVQDNTQVYLNAASEGRVEYLGYDQLSENIPKVTSEFTEKRLHPVLGEVRGHNGIDVAYRDENGNVIRDSVIRSAGDGVVIKSYEEGAAGNMIKIRHDNGYMTNYFHASELLVQQGDKVQEGQPIMIEGKTGGVSTGEHLHFEVIKPNYEKINPRGVNVGQYDKLEDTPFYEQEKK
jgi:murein DD-endopeptidase MepM/ murein hydrolase activator NlpD